MVLDPPSTSPSNLPSSSLARRRSQSRSSSNSGPSSFRASLGGKSVGRPLALTSASQTRRRASSSAGGSAFSESEGGDFGRLVGSFSATREELRDGSARLASFSLLTPSPLASPAIPSTSTASFPLPLSTFSPPRPSSQATPKPSPSNLSLARPPTLFTSAATPGSSPETDDGVTPTQSKMGSMLAPTPIGEIDRDGDARSEARRSHRVKVLGDEELMSESEEEHEEEEASELDGSALVLPSEHTPLLERKKVHHVGWQAHARGSVKGVVARARTKVKGIVVTKEDVKETAEIAVASIPAVILGVLMNILDGVSYGMIMFPTNVPLFADFGGIGVSMFFVSCVVSQLVYTGGGSIFKGGNGSMMIEVVPFFHVIVGIISASCADNKSVVATTMVAFALSSVLTGLTFFALGALKLGSLSEFFPRHILVGCIGGVGAFLFVTGLTVSARLEDDAGISFDLIRQLFETSILPLWGVPLLLAVTLRLITARWTHPLIFPGFFLAIPLVFYAITLSLGLSVADLRQAGWVFEVNGVDSKWYEYWTLFDLKKTDFAALVDTIPTQLALVFFGLLHVPINVPALGISVGEDNVDTDRELVAHGISNVLAGMLGTVPNYLCYVNSVLFYKVGGTTRISGFLLALASFGVLIAGPGVIGYLPVCVVGALIFILGLDLVKEAVWDTHGRVAQFEYITIWCIIIVMTVFDFVMGIGVGIILACVSFVVSSSQRRAVRAILNGAVARSTVRRHPKQSAFLKEVGRQTCVIKLQGFLFFGTISACERTIRKILEAASWSANPIRFLVLDFSMASGVDFSAAEAFVRIQRLLEDKGVVLVLCGCSSESSVGLALRSVNLWAGGLDNTVEVFENQNDALEHCENAFLRSLYSKAFNAPHLVGAAGPSLTSQIDLSKSELDSDVGEFVQSPRASHLRDAAKETMSRPDSPLPKSNFQQPMPLLLQSLKPFSAELNEDACFRLSPYFKRVHVERGAIIWTTDTDSDSLYLIESGMLRASYLFLDQSHSICESMVAGTTAGEMSFLSRTKRNATVVAERDSVLWKLDVQSHEEMGRKEGWAFCRKFEQCLMRIAVEEQEVLMGHLISSL